MEKLLCPSLLNLSDDYLKDEVQKLDRSGADIVCGPESGKRFICFGHVILDHRVPLPGMGL